MRDAPTASPRLVRGNRYLERKGFTLTADFFFIDGKTGETLHKEKLLRGGALRRGPEGLAAVLLLRAHGPAAAELPRGDHPQKIRGTRVLLR